MYTSASTALQPPQTRATWQENFVTVGFGLWLIFGFFIDGYAHGNLRGNLDSFFTPWHAILYSGFMATAFWMIWLVVRRLRQGLQGTAAVPVGYELGLVGVLVFGVAGVSDLIWHSIFGIEVNLNALRSPSHLLLFIGAFLLMTAPIRAAWHDPNSKSNPSFLEFLPNLFVITACFGFATLMNLHFWGLTSLPIATKDLSRLASTNPMVLYNLNSFVDAGILATNAMILSTLLLLLKRWRTPFGTFAIVLGFSTLLLTVIMDTTPIIRVYFAFLAGGIIDALIYVLKPSTTRIFELRTVAVLAPIAIWGLHFLAVHLSARLGISTELWTGSLTTTALSGLGLSVLMTAQEPLE